MIILLKRIKKNVFGEQVISISKKLFYPLLYKNLLAFCCLTEFRGNYAVRY
jgi:hypothetical protein